MPMRSISDSVHVAVSCRDAYIANLIEQMRVEKKTANAETRKLRTERDKLREENSEWKIRYGELKVKYSDACQGLISGQSNTLHPTNETQKPDSESEVFQLKTENERLKEEVIKLTCQIEDNQREKEFEEMTWHDKVRLELLLRLLEKGGIDMQDVVKARVAEVMMTITKLPISTCKNYCTNRDLNTKVHEEEVMKLNSILQAISMGFYL
jgi:hypothetical protein